MTLLAPALLFLAALAQDPASDQLKKEMEKLKAENATLAAQVKALTDRLNRAAPAAESPAARQLGEDLKLMEEQQVEQARRKKAAEELARAERERQAALAALAESESARRVKPPLVYKTELQSFGTAIEGKVTAIANEIGLVVVSVGKDDGVREGDEFTIYRSGDFVAKIKIDRCDRNWSAGKIILKKGDPRVADAVSNHILVSGGYGYGLKPVLEPVPVVTPSSSLSRASSDELKALRKELDEVRGQVQSLSDRILPSWKDAGVTVEEASEALCSQLQMPRGLLVRRVREGSPAARILKPNDVIPDRTEAQVLEVLRSGGQLPLRRQGKLEIFQVDPTR
jgi:hypothetical protein